MAPGRPALLHSLIVGIALAVATAACGSSLDPVLRPAAHAGMLIIPVDRIADVEPPAAIRLVGRHPRLPVWLHVDRSWNFRVVDGRCGGRRTCAVGYDAEDDLFRCACTGVRYRASGRAVGARARPLRTADVLYRDEIVLVDLDGHR